MKVIEKVKYNPFSDKPTMVIHLLESVKIGDNTPEFIQSVLKSKDTPDADFGTAQFHLTKVVCELLLNLSSSFHSDDSKRLCTGVTYSYDVDQESGDINPYPKGAVFTLLTPHEAFSSPFLLNTPFSAYDDRFGKGETLMPSSVLRAAECLREQAIDFVKGKRAQGQLFKRNSDVDDVASAIMDKCEGDIDLAKNIVKAGHAFAESNAVTFGHKGDTHV